MRRPRVLSSLRRPVQALPARHEVTELLEAAGREVDRVTAAGGPVLAGPWLGEVGYELLYWVPFLTWAVERRPELRERLHVVSRGGPTPWYAHLTTSYADAYAHYSPEEVSERRGKRSKQVAPTAFEEELAARAAGTLGLERYTLLHPGALYEPLLKLFKLDATPAVRGITSYRRLEPPRSPPPGLPDEYTAVRFYFSAPFPETPDNRAFVHDAIEALTAKAPVVVLNTGLRLDDHVDADALASGRVVGISEHIEPATNLAVQTAVVAGARAFVGTYGGLSYLAPLFGVPSVAFHSAPDQFLRRHLELAHGVFAELDVPYLTLPTSAAHLLGLLDGAPAR